jgi:flagellar motility protein MotE (MotC chaperone)
VAGRPRVLNGRYRLVYTLGAGGMGSVWLAEDQLLERSVALKELIVPHAESTSLPERRARALQEARALARVRHPSIVPIHDVFFIDENPWIVMEHINGHSLADIISGQGLDERLIARIGISVLRGLIAVHKAGVVHRDVKPTNILVADDGSVFLVDFGIARIAGDTSLTGHSIVGTPDFLAPERFRSGNVGPPADIWALGVTFYLALEGYSPFGRNSESGLEATMQAILNERPRPPGQGGWLADITMRMLDKDPDLRATAEQALAILEDHVGARQAAPRPAAPPAPRPAPPRALRPVPLPGVKPAPARPSAPGPDPQPPRSGTPGVGRQPGEPRFAEAREMIKNVGIDTGVAMLLGMTEDDAARVLADCPPKLGGELLQGIAAVRPATAATILRILRSTAAGRAFAYLRPATAAALLAVMQPQEAVRVLDSTDERSVAAAIMELPVPTSAILLKSMCTRQRAARVLSHVRPFTAAELLRSDTEFAASVFRHLSEPVRKQVSRHLASHRDHGGT